MGSRPSERAPCGAAILAILVLASAHLPVRAQCPPELRWPRRCCPTTPFPPCAPAPAPAEQPQAPPTAPPSAERPPAAEPAFAPEQAAALGGENVALAAPNMIGNLLGAGRSVSFFYQRSSGSVFINGTGSTSIVNPKVADNNSPIPEDRLYFRYNFFSDSLKVTGDSGAAVFDPTLGVSRFSQPRFRGITTTKSYDVNDFIFGGEKTYCDGRFSVEVRIPFSHTLSNNLNLSVADVTGVGTDNDSDSNRSILRTTPTPQKTLGDADTEFGNMSVVLKGLAYQSRCLAISGGLAIGIPTAQDAKVQVTDFLGDNQDNDIEVQRRRDFQISNDTWALSPFIAVLATPSDRLFAQGFLQFDFPVNRSTIRYAEFASINTELTELPLEPLFVTDRIREQTLMQVDIGTGYWVVRNPRNRWLTGVAPTIELHYTTALDNADIQTLPTATRGQALSVVGPGGAAVPEPNPTVGNLRNRIDLLDMTVGTTFLIANRATIATGFAFPLRSGDDRTYDWEFQLQLNYYFGGGANRARFAPNF